ncbi:hypothetical protein M0D21_16950 [Aquimarina sp. D1M17]|uniref:hypothetical protein n=1 Tax=Aquimarina acroporae TaxID=2937283 RepID=UPI0020BDF828|nr:hypothetical protein [Aquimarina acroporae]MCK8523271.1 hypothetical protein [Aquimarina acroporae]
MIKKSVILIGVLLIIGVIINLFLDLNKLEENINMDNSGKSYLENDHVKISRVRWGVSSNHTEILVLLKKDNLELKFNNSIYVEDNKDTVIIYSEEIPKNYVYDKNNFITINKIDIDKLSEIRKFVKDKNLIEIIY